MKLFEQEVVKSANDPRTYLGATLDNQMQVLVVQDMDCQKSGVSLSVGVGSIHSPKEFEGLPHFLEHMLFLGTEKYPDASDYTTYLSQHGGSYNAYTADLLTNYHFEVNNEALSGALDRFAQFFIGPTMTEELTEREMKAVNSEHSKNIQSDIWREAHLTKVLSDPSAEFNSFNCGDLSTLNKPGVRDALLAFHHKYYSANIMKLCVVSPREPMAMLEELQGLFGGVVDKQVVRPRLQVPPYPKDRLGKEVRVVPSQEKNQMSLMFVLPPQDDQYDSCCAGWYLSHLIGHEGKNSLLAMLQDEGLARSLSCGGWDVCRLNCLFAIEIGLTKQGLLQYQQVLRTVFAYIAMLKKKGVEEWVYQETRAVRQIEFMFLEQQRPHVTAERLTPRMMRYPLQDVNRVYYSQGDFNAQAIQEALQCLSPDNMQLSLFSKDFQGTTDLTEQYYGINYSVSPIDPALMESLAKGEHQVLRSSLQLDLPEKNPFIAKDLQPMSRKEEGPYDNKPVEVGSTERTSLYYQRDNKYLVPKAHLYVKLFTNENGIGQTSKGDIFLDIWSELVKMKTSDLTYLSEMASLYVEQACSPNGVQFHLHGLSPHLPTLLKAYFSALLSLDVSSCKNEFAMLKEKKVQAYCNYPKYQSYQLCIHFHKCARQLRDNHSFKELHHEAQQFSFEDFLAMHAQWLKQFHCTLFVTGDLSLQTAQELREYLDTLAQEALAKDQIGEVRPVQLDHKTIPVHEYHHENHEEKNSALLKVFQLPKGNSLEEDVLCSLLVSVLKTPAFEQLRTVEQLGYIVFTYENDVRGVKHLQLIVQSDVQCPHYLAQRMEAMLDKEVPGLSHMSHSTFLDYKEGLRKLYAQKDYKLQDQAKRMWAEIAIRQYKYDRRQQQIDFLATVTKEQLLEFARQVLQQEARQMELHVISHQHKTQQAELAPSRPGLSYIESIPTFRQTFPAFPDYYTG